MKDVFLWLNQDFFSLFLVFRSQKFDYNEPWCEFVWDSFPWGLLSFLNLYLWFAKFGKFSNIIYLNTFFNAALFPLLLGLWCHEMLDLLLWPHKSQDFSLSLFSPCFLKLSNFFCSIFQFMDFACSLSFFCWDHPLRFLF